MAAKPPRQIPILPSVGGMNNVRPPSHAAFQPRPVAGGGLAPPEAVTLIRDMDLDSDGAITTRAGAVTVLALSAGRRLIAKGGMVLVQDGTDLQMVNLSATPSPTATTLVAGLSASARLLAHEWPTGGDRAWITDGAICRRIRAGAVASWGLPVPASPTATIIAGTLPAASYLVSLTYRDGPLSTATAQEGGAGVPLRYTLTAAGGLRLVATVTDPFVTHVAFHVSDPDQPMPYRSAVVAVVGISTRTATADFTSIAQIGSTIGVRSPVRHVGWEPPPVGITAIGSYQDFLLVSVGNALYPSWGKEPNLFKPGERLIMFPATITSIVGLQDGTWVGTTDGLYWMTGGDPKTWRISRAFSAPVIPEGALLDGEAIPELGESREIALFATRTGLVAGLPGGQAKAMTKDRYHFTTATRVQIAYRSGALRQVFVAVTG